MSACKVVVSDHVFESFEVERELLAAVGAELEVCQCKSVDELRPHLAGAQALLNTYMPGIGRDVFEAAPELKIVVRYGIGVDTIDVPEATRRGIMVANVPDYCVDEVADHAGALFLALARKVCFSDRKVKAGEWSLSYLKPMKHVGRMRAGIIGFGRIGRAIADRIRAFGVRVCFADPAVDGDVNEYRKVGLDDLYADCDAIFVQCPSTPETHHLIDRDACGKMRRAPILINTARGAIVDTDAVVWALRSGKLSAAGLDLLEDEKAVVEVDHPLKHFDNVILTPHSAWYSESALPNLQRKAAEEVVRVLKGERPRSLLNPEALKRSRP